MLRECVWWEPAGTANPRRSLRSYCITAWARRGRSGEEVKVTEGRFTMVAIDEQGRPRPVPSEP